MAGVKHNLQATLYGTAAVAVGQIALVPLFLHSWGQVYYGQWLVLSAVPAYLALSDVGISNALGNEFSIAVERGENTRAENLIGAVWRFQAWFALALGLVVALALATLPLQSWLKTTVINNGEFIAVLLLLTAYSLLPLQTGSFSGVYRAAHAYPQYLFLQGHMRVLEVLGTAILLWMHLSMIWLAGLLVLMRVVMLFLLSMRAGRLLPALAFRWRAGSWSDFRSLLPSGAGFFGFPVGNALINQGVTLVVNNAGGPGAVVLLSVCRQVGRVFLQGSSILFTSLHPELTIAFARHDRGRMQRLQSGAFALTLILGTVFSLGAFLLGGWVVRMWTGIPAVSGVLVGIFTVEAVTAALGNLALVIPWAASRLGVLPMVYLALQLLSLLASWVAFPVFGVAAVGLSFLTGNLFFGGVALRQSLADLGCRLPDLLRSAREGLRDAGVSLRARFS
jgi:O-antigen/teichoic acid export membrane protein